MIVGKKANFRVKITDANSNTSKTFTVYEGQKRKSLDEFYKEIIEHLRTKE